MIEEFFKFLIFIPIIFIALKTYKIYIIRKKYSHIPGPKTNGIIGFYLGNLSEALRYIKGGKLLADMMLDMYIFLIIKNNLILKIGVMNMVQFLNFKF